MYFGLGLLSVTGETHRRQRKLTAQVFSAANIKRMVPLFHAVAREVSTGIISIQSKLFTRAYR